MTASQNTATGANGALTDRQRTLIFLNIVIACVATSMLSTAMTTALPALIADLSIDVNLGQWVTSGYSLAMAIVMPLTAFLITRFPTRPLYLTGIGISIAGVALCAVAPTFPVLMAARVLQALGNGILTAMAQVVLLSIYPASKRGSIMGWYGLSVSAAPVIAPTIAGMIVDSVGWRAVFWIALPVIGVAGAWALAVFRNVLDTQEKRFDTLSFALSAVAFAGVTLGVSNAGSPAGAAALVAGLVAGAVFAVRQLRAEEPFLDVRTFRNRNFALAVVGSMLLYLVMMGSSTIMPLYVQTILGQTATISALVVMPGSVAMAITSPFAGRIFDTLGMKPLFVVGAACLLGSNVGMALVDADTALWIPAAWNALRCVSIGCLMMPLLTWGTAGMSAGETAHASALLTSLRTVAGAVGTAVFVGLMNMASGGSVSAAGVDAGMHGLNVTFAAMAAATAVLLALGIFGVRGRRRRKKA